MSHVTRIEELCHTRTSHGQIFRLILARALVRIRMLLYDSRSKTSPHNHTWPQRLYFVVFNSTENQVPRNTLQTSILYGATL